MAFWFLVIGIIVFLVCIWGILLRLDRIIELSKTKAGMMETINIAMRSIELLSRNESKKPPHKAGQEEVKDET